VKVPGFLFFLYWIPLPGDRAPALPSVQSLARWSGPCFAVDAIPCQAIGPLRLGDASTPPHAHFGLQVRWGGDCREAKGCFLGVRKARWF
jgi:hypothetical protein